MDTFILGHGRAKGIRTGIVRQKTCEARAITTFNGRNELVVIKGPEQSAHSLPSNPDEARAQKIRCRIEHIAENEPRRPPSAIYRGIFMRLFSSGRKVH